MGADGAAWTSKPERACQPARSRSIAHADLPRAETLDGLSEAGTVTIVPDRHLDGTNVLSLPLGSGFEYHYGPGSFAAHCEEALRLGLDLRVRRVPALEWDIDTPDDQSNSNGTDAGRATQRCRVRRGGSGAQHHRLRTACDRQGNAVNHSLAPVSPGHSGR